MFGDSHVLNLAKTTQQEVSLALYALVCSRLIKSEEELFAGELAAAVAMFVLGNPATEPKHQLFREQNAARIEAEAKALSSDSQLCEILSGAAYNIGYGYYVASGGGRLMNRFLGFIRLEGNVNGASDSRLLFEMGSYLDRKDPAILRSIQSLKRLGIWRHRPYNPNEVEYYRAVHSLATSLGAPGG